jgi:hypothetical protein
MSVEKYVLSNLMPGEEIVCKAIAGRLSFSRRLPGLTVVATNKRFFILNPLSIFSKCRTFSYENIDMVDVRRGLVGAKLIIKGVSKKDSEVFFFKRGSVLSMFGIVSNQINSVKDPNYNDKINAQRIEPKQVVLSVSKNAGGTATEGSMRHLHRLARVEGVHTKVEHTPMSVMPKPTIEQPAAVKEHAHYLSTLKGHLSVTHRLHKHLQSGARFQPDKLEINYFAAGKALLQKPDSNTTEQTVIIPTQSLQQMFQQKELVKRKLDPDKDLKIFKIRKLRGRMGKGSAVDKGLLNPFNLFNAK